MSSKSGRPVAPPGLGSKGKKLWKDYVDKYDLRVDELRILEDACREVDLIERLEKKISSPGFNLEGVGSMGQPVASPLIQEVRQHRALVAKLLKSIELPEEEGSAATTRSTRARAAANARWRMSGS